MMRVAITIATVAVLLLTSCAGPVEKGGTITTTASAETSANFDLENVAPFLGRLNGLTTDPSVIASGIREMEVEQEREFALSFSSSPQMRLVVYLDDVDAPDLYFYGTQEQVDMIDAEFQRFFDELGL